MALHPNYIKGLQFTENFFDAVILRAGGVRLAERYTPPKDTQSVDYLIGDYATELKVLVTDPLDAPQRQDRLEQFLRSELPRGPLYVTAHRQEIALRGELATAYWEKYVGSAIPNRLGEAAAQIRATRTFAPGLKGGAVILVNAGGPSLDWLSFTRLTDHFQAPIPEIDMVLAINGIPKREPDGQYHIHSAAIAKPSHRSEADALFAVVGDAMRQEIEVRTGKASRSVEVDTNVRGEKVLFQLTPGGVKPKNPIQPLP